MQPDDEAAPIAPEAEAFKLGLFALVRLKAYDPMAAAVDRGRPAGDDVVAGRVRAAARRRSAGGARPAATARSQRALHARVRRARARHAQGRRRRSKPLLALLEPAAKAGLELTVAAIRALAQLGATDAAAALARLAGTPTRAPEHPARGRHGARHDARGRRAADGPGSAGPTSGRSCARPRCAPPPPSIRRASSPCSPAWSPIATGASARRSPRRSARFPPSWRPTALRADAAGRGQARHPGGAERRSRG